MFVSKPGADKGDKQQGGSQQNRIDQFIQEGIEDFKEGALHNDVQEQKHELASGKQQGKICGSRAPVL